MIYILSYLPQDTEEKHFARLEWSENKNGKTVLRLTKLDPALCDTEDHAEIT